MKGARAKIIPKIIIGTCCLIQTRNDLRILRLEEVAGRL
jgi:hypothetical protein